MAIKAGQIDRLFDGLVRINGVTASGGSITVTTPITTALSTAGDGSVSVPLQVASSTTLGVITGTGNEIQILDGTSKKTLKDSANNEVYGRLTQASGVYTLTFYSLVSGTETAYTFGSNTTIDFWFSYRFDFARLPKTFAIAYQTANINETTQVVVPASNAATYYEAITVSATNTLANLTKTPSNNNYVLIHVNGVTYSGLFSHFSISGKAITWSAANSGYSILTTDSVLAQYETNE